MKKLFLAFSAFTIVSTSCSSSSDQPAPVTSVTPTTGVLITKIISTNNGVSTTRNYSYVGNKATTTVVSNGDNNTVTYNGDLVTKMEEFVGTTLKESENYTYNTDLKVATYTSINYTTPVSGSRYDYIYNTDNTISITKYTGNATSQTVLSNTGKAFLTSGQITKVEVYYPATTTNPAYTSTVNYVYDSNLNPFSNVTGFNKLILQGYDAGLGGNVHNLLSATRLRGTTTTSSDVSTFTYNSSNYPVNETNTNTFISTPNSVSTSTIQYFY